MWQLSEGHFIFEIWSSFWAGESILYFTEALKMFQLKELVMILYGISSWYEVNKGANLIIGMPKFNLVHFLSHRIHGSFWELFITKYSSVDSNDHQLFAFTYLIDRFPHRSVSCYILVAFLTTLKGKRAIFEPKES